MQVNSKCVHQVRPPSGRFGWCSAVWKRFATTPYQTHELGEKIYTASMKRALLLRVAIYARNSAAWSVAHSRKVRGGVFHANMPALRNVHSNPDVSISRSMRSATSLEGLGC